MIGNTLKIFAFIFLFISCNKKEMKIYGKVVDINSKKIINNATIYSRAWVYNIKLDESYPLIDSIKVTNNGSYTIYIKEAESVDLVAVADGYLNQIKHIDAYAAKKKINFNLIKQQKTPRLNRGVLTIN